MSRALRDFSYNDYLKGICLFFFVLFLTSELLAETVFEWTDSAGVVHYGNKVPKGVQNATALPPGKISRYSSSKLISGFQKQPPKSSSEETPKTNSSRGINAYLEHEEVVVERNAQNKITSCSVTVKNSGKKLAEKVLVTFQFKDGTLIPTSGADQISAGKEELYVVSSPHLPITLDEEILSQLRKQPNADIEGEKAWKPTVVIEFK